MLSDIMYSMSHKIGVLTVVYQNYSVLQDFLKSLEQQTDKNFHVFIADASKDKKKISSGKIDITVTDIKNLGYAHGVNVGIREAYKQNITQYCVINDDTYFDKNFIKNIHSSFAKNPHSVIGGKIYYAPGYEYHKKRYEKKDLGNVIWYAGGITDWNNVRTIHRGVDEVDIGKYNKAEPTEFVTGCMMCFDYDIVQTVGLWDTSYFLYYEDADFCQRATRKNVPCIYDPSLVLWHKNAQSTDGAGSKLHLTYQTKNRMKFGLKYAPLRTKLHLLKNHFFSS